MMESMHFNVTNHLVRIEKSIPWNNGERKEIWYWEVSIADRGVHYFGTAIERSRGLVINWQELTSMHPVAEIEEHCKRLME
jgi:hypothetical protein